MYLRLDVTGWIFASRPIFIIIGAILFSFETNLETNFEGNPLLQIFFNVMH